MHSLLPADREIASDWFAECVATAAARTGPGAAQVAVVERSATQGAMAPLHRRSEPETYRVVAGRITFFVGGDAIAADAGDVVVAPAGAARTFRVESGAARWLVLTTVHSLDRFTDFGRAVSTRPQPPCAGWPSAHELAAVASIADANGIELLGPPGALPGVTCGD